MPPRDPRRVSFALERNEIFLPPVREAEKKVRQYLQRGAQTKEIKELPPIVSSEAQRKETKECPPIKGRQVITTSPLSRYKEGSKLDPSEWEDEEEKLCQVQKTKETSSDPLELARRIISMPNDYTMRDKNKAFEALLLASANHERKVRDSRENQRTGYVRLLTYSNILSKQLGKLNCLIMDDKEEERLRASYTSMGFTK